MRKNVFFLTFGKYAVTGALALTVFLSGLPAHAASEPAAKIKDIAQSSDYAMQSIRKMAAQGIIEGDENNNFHPHDTVTRAEAAKILVLSLGISVREPETPNFQDVSKDDWAYGYVEAAYQAGIVSGAGTVSYSFQYRYGDGKTIYCEKDVTILPNSPYVESVIPLSVNQLRIEFSDWVQGEDAGNPENYRVLDENENQIPVAVEAQSSFMGETRVVYLNFEQLAAQRKKLAVSVQGLRRFTDSKPVLPYSCTVVSNDQSAPDIERIEWNNDGKNFTSVTLYFDEPVRSGTVYIDNAPAGEASGSSTTIPSLALDGSQSHQIEVRNISDGINSGGSVVTGTARLYDPPKTETVPPTVESVDFTRDATGRVTSLIFTYDKELLPSIPSGGHITAFDESGTQIYGEQPILDENGRVTGYLKLFCHTPVSPTSGKTAVFPIADGVNIKSGRYTVVLPAYLVADTQYNESKQQIITVDFGDAQ